MKNLFKMSYQLDTVGFVWQNNGRNLLTPMALENVMLPDAFKSDKRKKKRRHWNCWNVLNGNKRTVK